MMKTEFGANPSNLMLQELGFTITRYGVCLRDTEKKELAEWAVVTEDAGQFLISLGVVAAEVNRFAFRLLKQCSEGRIKPQFPSYIGPPVFIAVAEEGPLIHIEDFLPGIVREFRGHVAVLNIQDWFRKAENSTPYAPAQSIILPAYYYLYNEKERLQSYLANSHLANPIADVAKYFEKLNSMSNYM
ncbi:hypothetical protein [Parvularcula dongshanensis]|uniref:Uncharacterized protein n=1 Tax=Parvularcula dongshanensis TaxID=1173995 RepID=A0A840HZT4_9PROT|nr:hypothetical protein [Parvularcula dongshanensis]MBB4657927.1 hypothetical protein [Parvularcula dongshanensis]